MPLITGTSNADTLVGTDEADTLLGLGGADELDAGPGNDSLDGGLGNDLLLGGTGADTLVGNVGTDTLTGGAGADVFTIAPVFSTTIRTTATDFDVAVDLIRLWDTTYIWGFIRTSSGVAVSLDVNLSYGPVLFLAGVGVDDLRAANFTNLGNATLLGGDGADSLVGTAANEAIDGGAGADTVVGNSRYDALFGGDGDDLLVGPFNIAVGGAGFDTLQIAAGAYTFVEIYAPIEAL